MPSVGAYIWCLTSQVSLAPTNCHLPGILVFSFPNKRSTIANANSSFKKVANANSSFFPLQGLWLRWRLKFAPADHEGRGVEEPCCLQKEASILSDHSSAPSSPTNSSPPTVRRPAPTKTLVTGTPMMLWQHAWKGTHDTSWWARAQETSRKVRGVYLN